jgi:uracil-DNA glycosylase family 4
MQHQFRRLRMSHPDYWNQPVPASGNPDAKLVVLGLAPGKHGANRTGVPFTGDASGDLLFATLRKLSLVDHVMITNVVKCLPIKNKPSTTEINNCQRYLEVEIDSRDGLPTVFLALGRVAHNALLKVCDLKLARFPFAHGSQHALNGHAVLIDSFHCSRLNTQTKRLTPAMFEEVVAQAAAVAKLEPTKRIASD